MLPWRHDQKPELISLQNRMASTDWDRLRPHALALLFVTAAAAATFFLAGAGGAATFCLSGAAVAVSAAVGGLWPGLVATLAAVLLARAVDQAPATASALFALEGCLISAVVIRLTSTAEEYEQEVE